MFTAIWNGVELAAGTDIVEAETRLYFRASDVRHAYLRAAPDRSVCEWKGGEAHYFDIVVGDAVNRAAAWQYDSLGPHAQALVGRIAFWRGVETGWTGATPAPVVARVIPQTPNVAKALGASDVVWRPSSLPPFADGVAAAGFEGYLIPSLDVLVDVIATPPADERPALIQAVERRADVVAQWNCRHPDRAYGYIAVWGSAHPSAADVAALRARGVVLALGDDQGAML
ncbi:MAG: DUF427 domain-containing protein [Sphingomonas sp.]